MSEMKIGEISKPRFEFRSFGQSFADSAMRMARLSVPVPEKFWRRESDEIYIMSRTNDQNNTKIRDGKMDIKTYVQTVEELEQWNPLLKAEFPVSRVQLEAEIIPAFMVEGISLEHGEYGIDAFMEMISTHPDLLAVRVHKSRSGYQVNDTLCELADVLINGARVQSINIESTELDDILDTREVLGLNGVENINYLQVIKRVVGMIDLPLAN